MAPKLVACSACACYVRREESECPHCGARIQRARNGAFPATAAALILGLATVGGSAVTSGCGDDETAEDDGATSGTDSTGPGAPAYGVPETVGQGGMTGVGGLASAYGVPETTGVGANGGAGGIGGTGGTGGTGGSGGTGGN